MACLITSGETPLSIRMSREVRYSTGHSDLMSVDCEAVSVENSSSSTCEGFS